MARMALRCVCDAVGLVLGVLLVWQVWLNGWFAEDCLCCGGPVAGGVGWWTASACEQDVTTLTGRRRGGGELCYTKCDFHLNREFA